MNNTNTYTITMDGMTFSAPTMDEAVAMAQAFKRTRNKQGTGKPAPAPKDTEYTKADGTVIMVTAKQAASMEARKERFEEIKAEYEAAHAAYKPSDELIAAIKADRTKVTRKVAKELYGFVGTKEELKALKDKVLAK